MTPRIITSEPTHKPSLTSMQRERMGKVLPAEAEGMSEEAQAWWLALIFIVIMPAAVGIYWSFVR